MQKGKNLSRLIWLKVGTSGDIIGRYKRGEVTPSIDVAIKIADGLEVSLDFLIGKVDQEVDQHLLKRIIEVQQMKEDDKEHILYTLDALIKNVKLNPSPDMEVTRPRQLVYFTYLATPVQEDMSYMLIVMDACSEVVIQMSVEPSNSEEATLRKLNKLMNNKDYKTSPKKPFILMTSCGSDFKDKMQAAIRPYKGNLIIDMETTLEETRNFAGYLASRY